MNHTKAGRAESRRSHIERQREPNGAALLRLWGKTLGFDRLAREQHGDAPYSITEEGVALEMTCSACPVQIEGTVDGEQLYFRARWGEWTCCIATDRTTAVLADSADEEGVHYFRWGNDAEDGWMPHAEAWELVRECIAAWRASR